MSAVKAEISAGSWITQGYRFFAGEGIYSRTTGLPPVSDKQRLILDLGKVANACRVDVNGRNVGVRIAPPWHFDLTRFAGKLADLTVRVANTPHNLFMQDSMPAGLLGPVTLVLSRGEK